MGIRKNFIKIIISIFYLLFFYLTLQTFLPLWIKSVFCILFSLLLILTFFDERPWKYLLIMFILMVLQYISMILYFGIEMSTFD